MSFLNEIPPHIKSKVIDKDWNEIFTFEEMVCNHLPDVKKHIIANCEICQYKNREKWIEDSLTNQKVDETIKYVDKSGIEQTKTLSRITVHRGKYDDVIGIEKQFI